MYPSLQSTQVGPFWFGLVRDRTRALTKTEKRPEISRSLRFLAHILAVNDFTIDVTSACQKKGFEGCWECDDLKTCEKLKVQDEFHGDAHHKNLRIIQKRGVKAFLEGKKHWYIKLKAK